MPVPDFRIPLEEGQDHYAKSINEAGAYIAQRGYPPQVPPQPYGNLHPGQLPESITTLTDDQLGELLNQMGRWEDFIQTDLAATEMAYKNAANQLHHIEAQLRLAYKLDDNGKKRTEQEIKDMMTVDRRYVSAKSAVIYYEYIYRYTEAIAKSADRNWQTVSRRISQRQSDVERGRREVAVGNTSPVFGRR